MSRVACPVAAAVATALVVAAAPGRVAAEACPSDAAEQAAAIRARLDGQRTSARRWRIGWGVGFGVAALGQLALAEAEVNPLGEFDDGSRLAYQVGAVKSAVGMAARVVIPLRVPHPAVTGDPCADLAAARDARRVAARGQRRSFWLNHVGGLALNVAGSAFLARYATWTDAAVSFGIGWAAGLASTYTMPRGAWRDERAAIQWQVTPLTGDGVHGLAVVGSF